MSQFFSNSRASHHYLEQLRYELVFGELRGHSCAQVLQVREELHFFIDVFEGELAEEQADSHNFGVEVAAKRSHSMQESGCKIKVRVVARVFQSETNVQPTLGVSMQHLLELVGEGRGNGLRWESTAF